jgi:hypothetical protein
MAYTPQLNPQPFGPVSLGATPATPVSLSSWIISQGLAQVGDPIVFNKISIVALPSNAGTVYIGQKTMNITTLAGVIYALPVGGNWQITNNVSDNIYDLRNLYIAGTNANDGVYGAIDTV